MTRMVCSVCARVLQKVTYGKTSDIDWLHPPDVVFDHPPNPVPDTEVSPDERCDFCHEPAPEFILPARDFMTPTPGQGSHADWAACETCANLLAQGQWSVLTRRAIAAFETKNGPLPEVGREGLRQLYRQLRKNVTGEVRKK